MPLPYQSSGKTVFVIQPILEHHPSIKPTIHNPNANIEPLIEAEEEYPAVIFRPVGALGVFWGGTSAAQLID